LGYEISGEIPGDGAKHPSGVVLHLQEVTKLLEVVIQLQLKLWEVEVQMTNPEFHHFLEMMKQIQKEQEVRNCTAQTKKCNNQCNAIHQKFILLVSTITCSKEILILIKGMLFFVALQRSVILSFQLETRAQVLGGILMIQMDQTQFQIVRL
jgi:hypothetical protein